MWGAFSMVKDEDSCMVYGMFKEMVNRALWT